VVKVLHAQQLNTIKVLLYLKNVTDYLKTNTPTTVTKKITEPSNYQLFMPDEPFRLLPERVKALMKNVINTSLSPSLNSSLLWLPPILLDTYSRKF